MEIAYDFGRDLRGITINSEDNIFVTNFGNYSIDKVSLNNGKFSISQSTNISSSPLGLAINSKNEIYFGTFSGKMKKTKEGIISNIAGDETGFADGIGKSAKIGWVKGICFDENDIAYFCDSNSIRKLTPDGKVITICGGESGYSDGKGKQAKFNFPIGIVYNKSSKIFYITDCWNNSIRTLTVDGNVGTLCKYSDSLQAIAIDGEGKLYVSTEKKTSGEGELITVDSKGEIKQMNISVKSCWGMAFNSKGDLFFTSDYKLCVIRNCTKYPPHPILAPTTNINVNETHIQAINNYQQSELQKLKELLANTQSRLVTMETKLASIETQRNKKRKLSEIEQEIPELESEEEATEKPGNDLLKWLTSIELENLFSILQDVGVKSLKFIKKLEESDLEGTGIKPLQKRILFEEIKKLK